MDVYLQLLAVLVAVATAVMQLLPTLRTAVRSDERNLSLLGKQIRRQRIASEMDQRLVLDGLLESRLRPSREEQSIGASDLYRAAIDGAQILVAGEAGSGKTILALTLVERSLDASSRNPDLPLMEVIPLRDWKGGLLRAGGWKGFSRWMAGQLHRSHPLFGRRFFYRLLVTQKLIPCLDGLDELSPGARSELLKALRSYLAAGFPVVVLSRDSETLSSAPDEAAPGTTPRLDRYELLPLSDEVLRQVPDWDSWEGFVTNARQPRRAAALLRNPLQLSLAALTWRRHERSSALRTVEDPERWLWQRFFDRRLGLRDNPASSLRRNAGLIAVLSKQRDASGFRPSDLYLSSRAIPITVLLCAIPILVGTWYGELLELGIVTGMVIMLGFSDEFGWHEALTHGIGARLSDNARIALAMLAPMPLVFGAALCGYLVEGQFGSWSLSAYNLDIVLEESLITAASLAPLTALLALSDLKYRRIDDLAPSWVPRGGVPLLAALVCVISYREGLMVFFCFSALALVPWVYVVVSRLTMMSMRLVPVSGLRGSCQELARAGLLYRWQGTYRFRHDEIARRLGQETINEMTAEGKLGLLPLPRRAEDFVDRSILPAALSAAERLTGEMERLSGSQGVVVSIRTVYLCWGALAPQRALPLISSYAKRRPRGTTTLHLAEVLDACGKREEADRLWSSLLRLHRSSSWVTRKWLRREVLLGDREAAIALLRMPEVAQLDETYFRLLLAELQCRFGSEAELSGALEALTELRGAVEPEVSLLATLELARVHAELEGAAEKAEALVAESIAGLSTLSSLQCARYAQLRFVRGEPGEAVCLSREALGLVDWNEDPMFQLEVLATAAAFGGATGLNERIDALLRFGWKLPGRRPLLPTGQLPPDVLARIYAEPRVAMALGA